MDFAWDETKAAANATKHRVSFEEAAQVFRDPLSDTSDDPDHSDAEDRFIILGMTLANRLLFVSFTEQGDKIRIISAREATKQERKLYEDEP